MERAQDVLSFGPERRWRPPRRVVVAVLAVLSGAILAAIALLAPANGEPGSALPTAAPSTMPSPSTATPDVDSPPPCVPVGWAQSPPVGRLVAGLGIDHDGAGPGSGLDRCDRTAVDGPWTVVVRRREGSLGRHGAVVTFPVEAVSGGGDVDAGHVTATTAATTVVWPLAGSHARIRGDLTERELRAVAAGTTVVAGRPVVRPPAGLAVVTTGPYRSPVIHELRYGSSELGEGAVLGGGLTYTGVTSGGGFEDQLYATRGTGAGTVDGRPAVVSAVLGGNATLAWEPSPGLVAYVGYSGAPVDDRAVAALRRLAGQARLLDTGQWLATGPQTVDQVNEPG